MTSSTLSRGFGAASASDSDTPLQPWEELATESVGNVIEFWGFKRNQGRLWAVLYLRDEAMSAARLQATLGLSKGAVSMLTRELEQWRVIERVRPAGQSVWHFRANTDLMRMIGRVLKEREGQFIARVRADLSEARRLVEADTDASPEVRLRVARMGRLADHMEDAVELFVRTARLDLNGVADLLGRKVRRRLTRSRR
jgi:DNA-binding transcriptional regulator GbsR (MarR family)